jgi:hypothetical protein
MELSIRKKTKLILTSFLCSAFAIGCNSEVTSDNNKSHSNYSVVQAPDMSRQFAEAAAIRTEQRRQQNEAQEELRGCRNKWKNYFKNEEEFRVQLRSIQESIETKISPFNPKVALDLLTALAKWNTNHQTEAMADIACSADRLTGEIEEFLDQVKRVPRKRSSVIAGGLAGESFRQGMIHLTQAAESIVQNTNIEQSELQISEGFREMGKILIDLATAMKAGASVGRNIYEAITGHNPIDGRELETDERSLAVEGVTRIDSEILIPVRVLVIQELNTIAREKGWIHTSEHSLQQALSTVH